MTRSARDAEQMSLRNSTGTATVCYLTKRFPRLSETFILDEILGLESEGVPLRLFAIAHPAERHVQTRVANVVSPVKYLRRGTGRAAVLSDNTRFVFAHIALLLRHPLRWLAVVGHVVISRRHRSTLRHLLEAGLMAKEMDRVGATHIHAAFAHGPATIAHFVSMLTGRTFSFAAHAKDLYLSSPDILTVKASAAEFVLVCSHSASDELRRIVHSQQPPDFEGRRPNIVYAPHGVDTTRFQPAGNALRDEASRPRRLRILAVGRLVPKKGYSTLLEALRILRDQGEDFECRVVGGGDLRDCLVAQASVLELSSHVSFMGSLTQDQIIAEYHQADVFVQASVITSDGDRDGIPNVVLEAMASGLAVVASSVAGIPEVIDHRTTGLLVPPADPAALAEAIRELAADPETRARLSSAARRYVAAHLAKQSCIAPIAEILRPSLYAGGSRLASAHPAPSGSKA